MNLTEILKGYGEKDHLKFWSPIWGECEYLETHNRSGGRPMLKFRTASGECRNVTPQGCLGYKSGGECIIFPSKEDRDWENYTPPKKCIGCWEFISLSGDIGVCAYSDSHLTTDSTVCQEHYRPLPETVIKEVIRKIKENKITLQEVKEILEETIKEEGS